MPDARALREITDALRALKDRADRAGSPEARAILTMTANALHRIALEAELGPPRRPAEVVGEVSDLDIARAVFDVACRRRPGCRVIMRKRGWVLGTRRPGEGPDGAA